MQPVYEALRDEILGQLRAALPVDMVALGLHGAMVADRMTDCEGDLLGQVRALVGPDVVLGAELDCHAHLTERMQDEADVLVFFKEYPHTDYVECGEQLLDLLERTRLGSVRPVMRSFHCHMIAALPTRQEPVSSLLKAVREREAGSVLSISIVHGFPRGDVPEMGAQILVTTDNDAPLAERTAREFGHRLFAMREELRSERPAMADTLDQALATAERPLILVDADDNPGSGAAGDNTELLRMLLDRNVDEVCAGPLWDPMAVRFCFDAGVGARLPLRVGGKVGLDSGLPLDVRAEVIALKRGHHQRIGGFDTPLGDAAAIVFSGITLVLVSVRDQAYDPSLFSGLGIDCATQRLIVLKSLQQFHLGFDAITERVFMLRRPSRTTSDAAQGLRHAQRPLWPLDEGFTLP
ncbi:MAG: M81 family metallopeptidase, partial [Chitinophagaceae bacterium]|nr:M81 family metallopeptidase [Rubrivivax sp.]